MIRDACTPSEMNYVHAYVERMDETEKVLTNNIWERDKEKKNSILACGLFDINT